MVATRGAFRKLATFCVVALFSLPVSSLAQATHVVSPSDLQRQTVVASQVREQNIAKVRDFLSNPLAAETLKKARVDTEQVKQSVSQLDDQELSQLAARADKAEHDFAAGRLSTIDIALIILGVALIIIIIAVVR